MGAGVGELVGAKVGVPGMALLGQSSPASDTTDPAVTMLEGVIPPGVKTPSAGARSPEVSEKHPSCLMSRHPSLDQTHRPNTFPEQHTIITPTSGDPFIVNV